jgi:hypothetical protein
VLDFNFERSHQCFCSGCRGPLGLRSIWTNQPGSDCGFARAEHDHGDGCYCKYETLQPERELAANTSFKISTLNDPRLSQGDNAARNRRLLYILSYASGCIIGATMSFGTAGSLFFVSAMKLVVTASFLLNRGRVAGRFIEAGGLRDENYELATTLSKPPLSPWRN